jgi:anaphase-promoting complex subunit 3
MEVAVSATTLGQSVRRALRRQLPEHHTRFLAERLYTEAPSAETCALYAEVLAQYGKHREAADLLTKYWQQDIECRYWYAICCVELNELTAAYQALSFLLHEIPRERARDEEKRAVHPNAGSGSANGRRSVPWLAEGLYLLGRVLRSSNTRIDQAAACFRYALELDPFLWCCVEELSSLNKFLDFFAPRAIVSFGKEEARSESVVRATNVERWIAVWKAHPPMSSLETFHALALVHALVEMYRSQDAISLIDSLPNALQESPSVLKWKGRAYLEAGALHECVRTFEQYQSLNKSGSLDGLEYYSTALWHMRRDVELNALARHALEQDRFAASTWCIVGNAYSLQRDPDSAIEFFLRAAQIDPRSAYACTLAGHEYLYLDNYESAMRCYQDALCRNNRHYNAWFGIGQIYQRQEKFRLAEKHYQIALDLNPHNSMLWYYLGHVIRVGGGRESDALHSLERALQENPRNPVARFELCKLYMQMGRFPHAWKELSTLREMVPREAAVYYQMGIVARELGIDRTAELFSTALDLDPKQPLYRQALLSLEESNVMS